MNHHDPADPTSPEHGVTVRRLRHGLDTAGRGVHAPAGIAAAALNGGRRRRRHRRAAVVTPIALVAAAVAGLGWQQPRDGQVRTVPLAEQVHDGEAAATTVDDVLAQLPDDDGVGLTQEVLIDQCLSAQGLDVERGPVVVDAADAVGSAVRHGEELTDLSAWTAHGWDYGVSASIRAALDDPGAGELGGFVHGIPAGYQQAVYGDPPVELTVPIENGGSLTVSTTGCYGRAVQQLYGTGVETYTRTYAAVRGLPERLLEQATADDALRTPLHAWAQCMHDRGYDVTTPADLPTRLQRDRRDLLLHEQEGAGATDADLSAFAAAETVLATADRDCKDTSALGAAFAGVLTHHWASLAGDHTGDLAAYRVMTEHARTVAAEMDLR